MLAPLADAAPAALVFGRERKGRPFLRPEPTPDFNLTDTGGGSLIAICRHGRVGVDIERHDRQLPVARLAARWFAAEEAQALAALDAEAARVAFLRLWTAKEASCKATGTGIFGYLPRWQFEVTETAPIARAVPDDAGAPERWRFLRLAPSPEHTAVVAMRDANFVRVNGYTLSD